MYEIKLKGRDWTARTRARRALNENAPAFESLKQKGLERREKKRGSLARILGLPFSARTIKGIERNSGGLMIKISYL